MSDIRKHVRVFLASPGDLSEERKLAKAAVDEFNGLMSELYGYQVDLIGWEDTVSPLAPWTVDGKTKTYAEMWRSGIAELGVLWLLLLAAGCWGVGLRKPGARWLLVFSPFASLVLGVNLAPLQLTDVFSAILCAGIVYVVLFRLRSVRLYFGSAA